MAQKAMQIGKELPYLTRQKILSVAKNYQNPLYDVKLQREYQKMPKVVQILQHLTGPSIVLPENVKSVSFISLSMNRDGSDESQINSTADNILQRLAYHNQRVRVNRCVLDKSAITSNQQSLLEKYIDHDACVRSLLSGSDVSSQSSSSSARSALADDAGSRSPKKLDTMSLYIKDESLMQNQQLSVEYVAVDTSSAAPIIPSDASFIGYNFEDVVHRIQLPSLTHYADHGNLFAALNTAQQTGSCVFLNVHLRNGAGHHQLYSLTAYAQNNGFRVQVQSYVHPRLLDLDQCGIVHQEQPLTIHAPYKTTCFSVPQSVPLIF
ncbi:hypothetical protein MIR68_011595 [Amoeboaphelidium protococcarum]|nr:hypothetical protein MIR68_011595 [Amoeboaphelidium protococcarum]